MINADRVTDRKFPGPALVAGFHRHAAYRAAGVDDAEVEVRSGTFAEAWLAGYRSNLTHGLRYNNAQKRAATELALKLFPKRSARWLADELGVSDKFVGRVRDDLIQLGKIEPVERVTARDGRSDPANIQTETPVTANGSQWLEPESEQYDDTDDARRHPGARVVSQCSPS